RNRTSWRRTSERWRSSTSCHARSPSSAARSLEPTMSVKSTVASTRSGSASSQPPDSQRSVRNRSSSRDLDELGSRDLSREVPGHFDRDDRILASVQEQGWHADRREHVADVYLLVRRERLHRARARPLS